MNHSNPFDTEMRAVEGAGLALSKEAESASAEICQAISRQARLIDASLTTALVEAPLTDASFSDGTVVNTIEDATAAADLSLRNAIIAANKATKLAVEASRSASRTTSKATP